MTYVWPHPLLFPLKAPNHAIVSRGPLRGTVDRCRGLCVLQLLSFPVVLPYRIFSTLTITLPFPLSVVKPYIFVQNVTVTH